MAYKNDYKEMFAKKQSKVFTPQFPTAVAFC